MQLQNLVEYRIPAVDSLRLSNRFYSEDQIRTFLRPLLGVENYPISM